MMDKATAIFEKYASAGSWLKGIFSGIKETEKAEAAEKVVKNFNNPLNVKKRLGDTADRYLMGSAKQELMSAARDQGMNPEEVLRKRDAIAIHGKSATNLELTDQERQFVDAYNAAETKILRTRTGTGVAAGVAGLAYLDARRSNKQQTQYNYP
jgi:HD-GYP domain-containing protein (c-di-GMP phosphodiesterase class II)